MQLGGAGKWVRPPAAPAAPSAPAAPPSPGSPSRGETMTPAAPMRPPPSSCRRLTTPDLAAGSRAGSSPPSTMGPTVIGPTVRGWTDGRGEGGPRCRWGPTVGSGHGRADPALRHPGRTVRRRAGRRARRPRPVGHRHGPAGRGGRPRLPPGHRRARPRPVRSWPAARVVALFTIGETPWSAEQRSAPPRRGPGRADLGAGRALGHRSCYGWDDYRPAGRGPIRRPPLDPVVHARRGRSRPSGRGPPRCRPGTGTTRCTRSATSGPTPPCCSGPVPMSCSTEAAVPGTETAETAAQPDTDTEPAHLRVPARLVLHRGDGTGLLHVAGPLSPCLGEHRLPASPGRRPGVADQRRGRPRPERTGSEVADHRPSTTTASQPSSSRVPSTTVTLAAAVGGHPDRCPRPRRTVPGSPDMLAAT